MPASENLPVLLAAGSEFDKDNVVADAHLLPDRSVWFHF